MKVLAAQGGVRWGGPAKQCRWGLRGLGGAVKMWRGLFGATRVPLAQPVSHVELEHLGAWLGAVLLLHP